MPVDKDEIAHEVHKVGYDVDGHRRLCIACASQRCAQAHGRSLEDQSGRDDAQIGGPGLYHVRLSPHHPEEGTGEHHAANRKHGSKYGRHYECLPGSGISVFRLLGADRTRYNCRRSYIERNENGHGDEHGLVGQPD